MTAKPEPMGPHVRHDCQHLLASVTGPPARAQTASTVERTRVPRLRARGARRWRRCVVTRAARRPAEPVRAPEGPAVTSPDQRPPPADSVLGHGCVARHSCPARGHAGRGPRDAELSRPAHGAAAWRRAGAVEGTPDASSRARPTVRARLLGRSRRVQALATRGAKAGAEGATCAAQPAAPPPAATVDTLLGLQAAGTGGPRVPPPPRRPPDAWAQGRRAPSRRRPS
jgi:hypothetical protein